jgi:hypothetical protein
MMRAVTFDTGPIAACRVEKSASECERETREALHARDRLFLRLAPIL